MSLPSVTIVACVARCNLIVQWWVAYAYYYSTYCSVLSGFVLVTIARNACVVTVVTTMTMTMAMTPGGALCCRACHSSFD
jgi:hypothetical protein